MANGKPRDSGIDSFSAGEPTFATAVKIALGAGAFIGTILEITPILIYARIANADYMVEPHKPITIQGYIHQMMLDPIQSGRLIPYTIAIDFENADNEMMKNLYKDSTASKP